MSIDYNKYFNQPLEKESYVVQLKLVTPKKDYDFSKKPEGINMKETFDAAVERFNTYKSRNFDNARISEVKIDCNCIYFMLEINKTSLRKINALVGNSLSKWLYKDYDWQKLVAKNNIGKSKLFIVNYKSI